MPQGRQCEQHVGNDEEKRGFPTRPHRRRDDPSYSHGAACTWDASTLILSCSSDMKAGVFPGQEIGSPAITSQLKGTRSTASLGNTLPSPWMKSGCTEVAG